MAQNVCLMHGETVRVKKSIKLCYVRMCMCAAVTVDLFIYGLHKNLCYFKQSLDVAILYYYECN